jgi:DNA-binding transcriptional regulator YiaG
MTISRKLGPDDAPYLKRGELKAMVESGEARIVRNKDNMVRVVRAKLNMSQTQFARAFKLSLRTVQEWEQGRYKPDQIARNYLNVIQKQPKAVQKALKTG